MLKEAIVSMTMQTRQFPFFGCGEGSIRCGGAEMTTVADIKMIIAAT
jgi:hypothetical protein